ncbi:MbcA/ParS/Xre antitoxin family protein [Variovorax sp. J22P240]|uniref:MbcA/ParS/Xre antitoxin family protein n=1 Tax=Variovorax sp. J22P240 TaxID=3053514 RepID=UPI0025759969|nr:MbcA/ParS/Xre antitoxin family protein [Variovorax sp. J22P240]MDM0001256.1 MbcA/ParS/Xre antitoxin family protein [Variovorax sp. J22P240]
MTMPQLRMNAFLRAGEILMDIVKTTGHMDTWGAQLPDRLVIEAEIALHHYPSWLEITEAADEQKSMHTWMVRPTGDVKQQKEAHVRLETVAARMGAQTAPDDMSFDSRGLVCAWLRTEHAALHYRRPVDLLYMAGNADRIVALFEAEACVSCKAKRVFASESNANHWLRRFDESLGRIPLEMLGSDTGRRMVMEELDRLTDRGESVN